MWRVKVAPLESEDTYRELFESVDRGFCVIELLFAANGTPHDYRFLVANPAYERLTGVTDVVGRTAREMIPSDAEHWPGIYAEIARTRVPQHFERVAEGLNRYYEVYAWCLGDPGQHRVALLFEDVSERKCAEAVLRESAARHAFLLTLSDALRPLPDVETVAAAAARVVGEHLHVNRAFYSEVDDDACVILGGY